MSWLGGCSKQYDLRQIYKSIKGNTLIYFTADLHFYHTNIIKYCSRPFRTVEHMNRVLIDNWNRTVNPDDHVYVLGDVSMAFKSIELFSNQLNGTKYLVPGNHDFVHSSHKKSRTPEGMAMWKAKYEENGWIVLDEQLSIFIGTRKLNLCHLPYALDHTADVRFLDKRMHDNGNYLLCGHIHTAWKTNAKQINVGVDVWDYKPVSTDTILKLIDDMEAKNNEKD